MVRARSSCPTLTITILVRTFQNIHGMVYVLSFERLSLRGSRDLFVLCSDLFPMNPEKKTLIHK